MKVLLACVAVVAAAPASAQKAPQCGQFPPEASSLLCLCPDGSHQGRAWGSGAYTADSDICSAARHAGVLGPEGGTVAILLTGPQDGFAASTANGVQTNAWGAYDGSFLFR